MNEKEVKRMVALANLKQIRPEVAAEHKEEMWHIIRGLAVLDWSLRQAEPPAFSEDKFETIMRKVRQVADQIQEEMESSAVVH